MNEIQPSPPSSKPPRSVVAAIACVAVTYVAGMVKTVFTLHWERPGAAFFFAGICLLLFLLLRGLYRGKRWAFWLLVIPTALGLLMLQGSLQRLTAPMDYWIYMGQAVLQLAALVFLLLPASRRWFFPR